MIAGVSNSIMHKSDQPHLMKRQNYLELSVMCRMAGVGGSQLGSHVVSSRIMKTTVLKWTVTKGGNSERRGLQTLRPY